MKERAGEGAKRRREGAKKETAERKRKLRDGGN